MVAAIAVAKLAKSYGAVQALRSVDLTVEPGEIFGFLGPNGSGKTTAIRCMLDLIRPSSGTVRIFGLDPRGHSRQCRERVGYLPGELHLDDNETAENALRLFQALRGRKTDWTRVTSMAERLKLDLWRPIKTHSRGNKQKVGVIQALMHQTDLLLLDEPTSGLDPLMQHAVLDLIRDARTRGATVFFSSHVLSEVEAISDRVAIIRRGEIVEVTRTESLLARAARRVTVRFREAVDLARLPDLTCVKQRSQPSPTEWLLETRGELDVLIRTLATLPIADMDTERPSLEEIFRGYYEDAP
ncbi:MAG: ABC transporter ATP-binding protein [Deltaproteobacteria bacterium]|nr:ABC transporter ATP-binding protein [Deltaproteobacteria bacterium]